MVAELMLHTTKHTSLSQFERDQKRVCGMLVLQKYQPNPHTWLLQALPASKRCRTRRQSRTQRLGLADPDSPVASQAPVVAERRLKRVRKDMVLGVVGAVGVRGSEGKSCSS